MNRTEKRCLAGSATLHGAAIGIFLAVTLGFSPSKEDTGKFIEMFSSSPPVTDGATTGGSAAPAPQDSTPAAPEPTIPEPVRTPEPAAPQREPEPVVQREPEPAPVRRPEPEPVRKPDPAPEPTRSPEPVRPPKVDLTSKAPKATKKTPEPAPPKPKPERKIDLTKTVTLDPKESVAQRDRARQEAADRIARQQAESRRRDLADTFRSASTTVAKRTSDIESVTLTSGSGAAAINYGEYIVAEFKRVWVVPSSATASMLAKATITVSSDGTISDAHLIGRSGNSTFDKSVETALKKVRQVKGFPAGASDQSRTYTIHFQPKSIQGNG